MKCNRNLTSQTGSEDADEAVWSPLLWPLIKGSYNCIK
jgi:hypothetical protein